MAYQNVTGGLENTHAVLEWYREKEIEIVFGAEAWIQRNGRGIQTHPSLVRTLTAKSGRRVMAYVRKGMEKELEVVKEENNHIILQDKNKNKIGGVYVNGRWHEEKRNEWLRKLEEEIGREGSILED